jgi:3-methyl-2-oxobutanoate hydroxymethyltransferase
MQGQASVLDAMTHYVKCVKDGSFPDNAQHAW